MEKVWSLRVAHVAERGIRVCAACLEADWYRAEDELVVKERQEVIDYFEKQYAYKLAYNC